MVEWILSIVLKTCVLFGIGILIKYLIQNGGGTLKTLLETTILAIHYGCLKMKMKLVSKLQEKEPEQEELKGSDNNEGIKESVV